MKGEKRRELDERDEDFIEDDQLFHSSDDAERRGERRQLHKTTTELEGKNSRRVNVGIVNLDDLVSIDLSDVGDFDRYGDISVCRDVLTREGDGVVGEVGVGET